MSKKTEASAEINTGKPALVPKLRFPEFRNSSGWQNKALGEFVMLIKDKAGNQRYKLMSITSGVGLVSQIEKFGREIAGQAYKNYIVITHNDFAYNKSSTKEFPEGFIALYLGNEPAAVPNSIFLCFRPTLDVIHPPFLQYQFLINTHGKWLKKRIAVGARAHGSLNVDENDLLSIPISIPITAEKQSLTEQQKIANCLSSLDELITTQAQKVEALKAHKKGLMQLLFPAEGETLPKLRFPKFRDAPHWIIGTLGKLFTMTSGGTPSRSKKEFWNGNIPWVTTSLVDFNIIYDSNEYISEFGLNQSSAKIFPKGTILIAMYGQGKTRGKVSILGIKAASNQACAAILPSKEVNANFLFQNLAGRYEEMRELSNSGGQENLSLGLIEKLRFSYPRDDKEQQKITDFLSYTDELITAQSQKLDALKAHKKGLMQQLFPVPDAEE